jgi:hypothetical protein
MKPETMYIYATYLFLDIYKVYPILRNRKVIYNVSNVAANVNNTLTDLIASF